MKKWVLGVLFLNVACGDITAVKGVATHKTTVQILAFNDFHGNLQPPVGSNGRIYTGRGAFVEAGGAEYFATHMARLAEEPNSIIVAAGDLIGASPLLSAAFHDEATIEAMNAIKLGITTVGNHEFDEGSAELLRMQNGGCHPVDGCQTGDRFTGAEFTYLSANVISDATGETLLPPYVIREFDDVRVAFIGLPLRGTPLVSTSHAMAGLEFFDEVETINHYVDVVKEQGVSAIVVLIHEGGQSKGLYNACDQTSGVIFDMAHALDPAVDVIVTGHTNGAFICNIEGKLITGAAHAGRLITSIHLDIDGDGRVASKRADNIIVTRDVPKDPKLTAIIAKYETLVAPIANRVIGRIEGSLTRAQNEAGESVLGNVIADAQVLATGADFAIVNPGGIRTDLLVDQISGGEAFAEVTFGEVYAVQPFDNPLMTFTLSGEQIKRLLEQQWNQVGSTEMKTMLQVSSALSYRWDSGRSIGDRIDPNDIVIDGKPLDLHAEYRVVANSFLAEGGDGFSVLREGTDRDSTTTDLTALLNYIQGRASVATPALDRISRS